jgi:hypothetical protein
MCEFIVTARFQWHLYWSRDAVAEHLIPYLLLRLDFIR